MAKKISPEIVRKIQEFRKRGWTVPELSRKFNVGRTTVGRYVRDIDILPEYEDLWLEKRKGSIRRKEKAEKEASLKANLLVENLSDKEKMLILSSLYWAEGAKVDSNLTNTDPELIRIFVKGLNDVVKIENDRIKLNIRIYEDMDKEKCINYWLKKTDLKRENLSSVNILSGKKNGKLEYGMCRVRIKKGGDVLKYFVAIRNAVTAKF